MDYVKLGNSDLMVSRICLGGMGFGEAQAGAHTWTLNYDDSKAIIKQALDQGINFFDTALAYSAGTGEQFMGRALRELASREDYIIATKFMPRSQEAIDAGVTGEEHIRSSLNQSLANLGLDYVDLYIYHMWDVTIPIETVLDILNDLVQEGKIRYLGISNCFAWQLAKANAYAEKMGYQGFVSVQSHYNLIMREDERELNSLCKVDNIALTPYSALAAGRLSRLPDVEVTKRLSEDTFAKFKYDATAQEDNDIVIRVHELAEKYDTSMTTISLAWLLTKVTSPVVGATKPHHIAGAVAAVDFKLSQEDIDHLEELYKPHRLSGLMANLAAEYTK